MLTLEIISELLKGREPINKEEQEWIYKHKKNLEQSKIKREEFNSNRMQYEAELEELINKYAPIEYKKNGVFTTEEFKKIEEKVELKIESQLGEIIVSKKLFSSIELNWECNKLKAEILKKEYDYDWYVLESVLPEEYFKELQKLRNKYNIKF